MPDLVQEIQALESEALNQVRSAVDLEQLRELEVRVLGRKGSLTATLRSLGSLTPEQKKVVGARANQAKELLTAEIETARRALERKRIDADLQKRDFDPTQPGRRPERGHFHPMATTRRRMERIFESMGFSVVDGPEVETEYYNFEALNIPSYHPARDMQDTFWTENGCVLRTHTSPVQVRAMRRLKPPLRVVAPGRVFRYETPDATHEHTFHQVEGLMIDRGISVAHMKGVMAVLLRELYGREVVIRLRPHYFPFVEPGFEVDFQCVICGGKGCSTCKRTGWIEMWGCGMVHPYVLQTNGVDPEEFTGFAFGMGIERLAMMFYGINDIRYSMSGDLRFLSEF
jgi:phenylalanyl-tRNA synthetase alpha chain